MKVLLPFLRKTQAKFECVCRQNVRKKSPKYEWVRLEMWVTCKRDPGAGMLNYFPEGGPKKCCLTKGSVLQLFWPDIFKRSAHLSVSRNISATSPWSIRAWPNKGSHVSWLRPSGTFWKLEVASTSFFPTTLRKKKVAAQHMLLRNIAANRIKASALA